jgi:hypothetical protein
LEELPKKIEKNAKMLGNRIRHLNNQENQISITPIDESFKLTFPNLELGDGEQGEDLAQQVAEATQLLSEEQKQADLPLLVREKRIWKHSKNYGAIIQRFI